VGTPPTGIIIPESARFDAGQFLFSITGPVGQDVIVESTMTLPDGWTPIWTNTLGSGPLFFSDPQSATEEKCYYRVRLP